MIEFFTQSILKKIKLTLIYSSGSIIMQQHSGVGIYQVVNPVIRDTVRPIPTINQIGMPKRKFFR